MQDKLRDLYAERLGIDNYEGGALIGARKKRRAPAKGKKAVINALVKAMTSKRKARGKGYIGGEDYENDYMGAALIGARKRRVGRPKKTRKYKGKGEYTDLYEKLVGGSSPYFTEAMDIIAAKEKNTMKKNLLKLHPTASQLYEANRDLYMEVSELAKKLDGIDLNISNVRPSDIKGALDISTFTEKQPIKKEEFNKKALESLYPGIPLNLLKTIHEIAEKASTKESEAILSRIPETFF